jgi:hypothetical protein
MPSLTARRAVARERRQPSTVVVVAACQGSPPAAMPPAPEWTGGRRERRRPSKGECDGRWGGWRASDPESAERMADLDLNRNHRNCNHGWPGRKWGYGGGGGGGRKAVF